MVTSALSLLLVVGPLLRRGITLHDSFPPYPLCICGQLVEYVGGSCTALDLRYRLFVDEAVIQYSVRYRSCAFTRQVPVRPKQRS
ncbi:hypothetical protein BDU57DRAFT_240670 [Ampelomyces quisqualis]|uniref:Secreted protein n=1 Tax=Ampelomyces quisqualis TaxID=50730 RepID=A0A6A5QM36_AMPQU|nr:hypothetical protein BDU57DRAFT_240670 [Ampelomyces quisqualis]